MQDNLELQIINEEVEKEEFKIDNDGKAEWALKKIKEEQVEAQRYINVCKTMILEYETKTKKAEQQLENKTSYLKGKLLEYFESVDRKATKTQETYKLPSGTLRKKYQEPELIKDEEKLIDWAESNYPEYIKTKKSLDWSNLKRSLVIKDEVVMTEEGEIIEGIKAQFREPKFEIDLE